MGKCYSMVDRGQRKPSDLYETPTCLIEEYLNVAGISPPIIKGKPASILTPACGKHQIDNVLRRRGYTNVTAYDIEDGHDFLKEENEYDYIIENPPYSLAFEFIQKAKQVARYGFSFLLPLSYLHGQRRYEEIWTDKEYPLYRVYVFTRYPMLGIPLREDGKIETGMQAYMWAEWSKYPCLDPGSEIPVIKWIDINKYILRKKGG